MSTVRNAVIPSVVEGSGRVGRRSAPPPAQIPRLTLGMTGCIAIAMLLLATVAHAADRARSVRRSATTICNEGSGPFASLSVSEVEAIVRAAATALDRDTATIAVVDRAGRPLALFRQPRANVGNSDAAVGVARTAAFFSHNMAPLSSRTVRFISGIHFPPGLTNAPNAALYGIENTNRGCSLNITFNPGKDVPPARSARHTLPCNSTDQSGCGPGIVTGKVQPDDKDPNAVNAGGIPLYRGGQLVGGIGVVGIDGDPQLAEFAAVTGAFGAPAIVPVPAYPLPPPGNVFIDGIRLPFLGPDQKLRFDNNGNPVGLQRPAGTNAGTFAGTYDIPATDGGCAPNEYLVGPLGPFAPAVDAIVHRAITAAKRTRAAIRLPLNSYARMVIAVTDSNGNLLALYRMPDATVFSIDVAVAKARNVVWFSRNARDLPGVPNGTAVTNRTVGFGAQPLFPPGIDSSVFDVRPGPFFDLFLRDLANPCTNGSEPLNPNQNGIVFFPGATALFSGNSIIGGLGISGDGVEQDDYVTTLAATETLVPPPEKWADRILIDGVRLPMFKFPRHPEGVTECGGKPCS
jgi:uncharacterized protein GlcG (DUF336 family)